MPRRTASSLVRPAAAALALAAVSIVSPEAEATWSIVMADETTGEVAVGTVTCLTSFDLLAIVPVVVVGRGGAAVQASGDFAGTRRPVIFAGLQDGEDPVDILDELADISGHASRQYGIVDTQGRSVTFTGGSTFQWAGGITGQDGSMHYAIQGNILAGACVVPLIENAILDTDGDTAAKLMAGMQAARNAGGDGRCSCSQSDPTGCGCPPFGFEKSGHIGGMIVARIGDTDDAACTAGGCADGDYLMRLNVAFQSPGAPDPVEQLQGQFDDWAAGRAGRPDGVASIASLDPVALPADGSSTATLTIELRDRVGGPVTVAVETLTVVHAEDSDGLATIGAVSDLGGRVFEVELTAGDALGVDRLVVTADDGVRAQVLAPFPVLEHVEPMVPGDLDGDGMVGATDLLALLGAWGPCPACPADLDGDGDVATPDLLILLSNWG